MSKASLELGGGNWAAKDNGDGTGSLLGYAVGDTSGKYLPREFTFSRGADIGATRVNKDGLIEKYRENLLTYSNQFDSWTVVDATATSGQTGYDGTSDAWLFTTTVAGASLEKSITASGVVVFSMYAKKGTVDGIRLRIDAATDADAYFNLSNNSVHSFTGSAIDASITDLGGGWQRCKVYANISSPVKVAVYTTDGTTAYDNGNIYIQDAQFEYGLVATDYLESGSTTGKAGVLDNLPRIDYTSGSAQLLMEPSRTNYVQYSEYFSAWASFTYGGASIAIDSGYASPEGNDNATRLSYTAGTGSNGVLLTSDFTATASVDYTLSVWMKGAVGGEKVQFRLEDRYGNGPNGTTFTLTNEWSLYTDTITNDAGTSRGFRLVIGDATGVTADQVVYVYGAQAELGSYATSYIPNYGTALGVTRNADFSGDNDIVGSPISFGANDDFTLFYEGSFDNLSSTSNMIMGGGNRFLGDAYKNYWWVQNATTIKITGDSQVLMASASMSLNNDTNHKLLVKRDGSTIDFFVDGSKLTTTQSAPNTAFVFRSLGWSYTNSVYKVSGNIKQALVFNSALTDAECIALTTL